MQLCLRSFYNILRQQNNFEWTIEHQKLFEEIKTLLTKQISNTIPDADQLFFAMSDASNSRLFRQAKLRLPTFRRKRTAIKYTLIKYEFLILGSKHPTVLFIDHKPICFLFTQKSNPNHSFYRFQLILKKVPNLHIVWTAERNLSLPDTPSRNKPPELITRKTKVEIPQIIKFFLAKDETSSRLECKYAVKTSLITHNLNTYNTFH